MLDEPIDIVTLSDEQRDELGSTLAEMRLGVVHSGRGMVRPKAEDRL